MKKVLSFIKHEAVLCAAVLATVITLFFVPPDSQYPSYVDWKVLAVLFSLMAVVAGMSRIGVFRILAGFMAQRASRPKPLIFALVLLCFFTAPFITNDVSLITFVPFTIMLLGTKDSRRLIFVIVAETVAANLGSLITPIGNPQNLYLFSRYELGVGEFFKITLPLGGICLALTLALTALAPAGEKAESSKNSEKLPVGQFAVYLALFVLCIAAVFSIIPWWVMLAVVAGYMLIFDRGLFGKVDYSLLVTFVFFFIFVGNMSRIEDVKNLLSAFIEGRTILASALTSQVVSNVPAATLLSAFTDDFKGLIIGTNIGGLGTPVASMASLISYRLYCGSEGAKPGRYMAVFSIVNFSLLALMLLLAALIY